MNSTVQSGDSWRRYEAVYDRFEEAWSVGGGPRVEEFLPPPGAPERVTVLNELVRIDLERNWERGQPVRVEDYLSRFPELATDGSAPLSLILHEIQVRRARGQAPAAEELRQRFPTHIDELLREPETPLVLQTSAPGIAPADVTPGSRLGRYEVREELGRGGFSSVYRAFDAELGREVAIKVPRPDLFGDSEISSRVLREARSAARLRHPAIVALHEVTQDSSRALLVYEFVAGPTLARLLRESRPSPQQAAKWTVTLAEALDYAHGCGIIHRDVKPANVLMRGSTEPVLADFGLARHDEALTQLTRQGDVLGTPAYMSPEQAAGHGHQVDRRSDVYSLGVVLYQMLTGRVPFTASAPAVLNQIIHDEPPPPRSLESRIPLDLDTICLKAIAKDRDRRYATAGEFAEDLRRYLNHQPIRARRIGPLGKLGRWCRREPRVAGLAAAVAALLLITAGVGGWFLWHNQQQSSARLEADLQDIDRELGFIGREELALVPQMDRARRDFLEGLAAKCRSLLRQRGDRPELRLKMAEVQLRLGTINELLGHYAEAEAAYREAIALHGESDSKLLGRSRYQLANLLVAIGRFDEAEKLFQLTAQSASSSELVGDAQQKLGGLYVMTGRFKEGEAALKNALDLQSLPSTDRPDAERRLVLAQTETSLAHFLTTLARFDEAVPLFDQAIKRQEELAAGTPGVPVYRLGLARSIAARGRQRDRIGFSKGQSDHFRAYELFKKLAEEHPHRPDYRLEFASALHNIHGHTDDESPEAFVRNWQRKEQRYRDAIAEQERLVAEFPAVLENHRRLAVTLDTLATWLNDKSDRLGLWNRIGAILEAAAVHHRSHSTWKKLVAEHPTVLSYRAGLATSHQRYGIVLERCDKFEAAEQGYRESITAQEELAKKFPNVNAHQNVLSALHNNTGVIYDRRKDLATAETCFRAAVLHTRRALEINPLDPTSKILNAAQVENLAEILLRRGRYQEAAPLLTESHQVWPGNYWDVPKVYGMLQQCVKAAKDDPNLTTAQRAELIRQYEDWTIADVRKLFADTHYPDADIPRFLEKLPSLEHVRHRKEFQQLLREIDAKFKKPK